MSLKRDVGLSTALRYKGGGPMLTFITPVSRSSPARVSDFVPGRALASTAGSCKRSQTTAR